MNREKFITSSNKSKLDDTKSFYNWDSASNTHRIEILQALSNDLETSTEPPATHPVFTYNGGIELMYIKLRSTINTFCNPDKLHTCNEYLNHRIEASSLSASPRSVKISSKLLQTCLFALDSILRCRPLLIDFQSALYATGEELEYCAEILRNGHKTVCIAAINLANTIVTLSPTTLLPNHGDSIGLEAFMLEVITFILREPNVALAQMRRLWFTIASTSLYSCLTLLWTLNDVVQSVNKPKSSSEHKQLPLNSSDTSILWRLMAWTCNVVQILRRSKFTVTHKSETYSDNHFLHHSIEEEVHKLLKQLTHAMHVPRFGIQELCSIQRHDNYTSQTISNYIFCLATMWCTKSQYAAINVVLHPWLLDAIYNVQRIFSLSTETDRVSTYSEQDLAVHLMGSVLQESSSAMANQLNDQLHATAAWAELIANQVSDTLNEVSMFQAMSPSKSQKVIPLHMSDVATKTSQIEWNKEHPFVNLLYSTVMSFIVWAIHCDRMVQGSQICDIMSIENNLYTLLTNTTILGRLWVICCLLALHNPLSHATTATLLGIQWLCQILDSTTWRQRMRNVTVDNNFKLWEILELYCGKQILQHMKYCPIKFHIEPSMVHSLSIDPSIWKIVVQQKHQRLPFITPSVSTIHRLFDSLELENDVSTFSRQNSTHYDTTSVTNISTHYDTASVTNVSMATPHKHQRSMQHRQSIVCSEHSQLTDWNSIGRDLTQTPGSASGTSHDCSSLAYSVSDTQLSVEKSDRQSFSRSSEFFSFDREVNNISNHSSGDKHSWCSSMDDNHKASISLRLPISPIESSNDYMTGRETKVDMETMGQHESDGTVRAYRPSITVGNIHVRSSWHAFQSDHKELANNITDPDQSPRLRELYSAKQTFDASNSSSGSPLLQLSVNQDNQVKSPQLNDEKPVVRPSRSPLVKLRKRSRIINPSTHGTLHKMQPSPPTRTKNKLMNGNVFSDHDHHKSMLSTHSNAISDVNSINEPIPKIKYTNFNESGSLSSGSDLSQGMIRTSATLSHGSLSCSPIKIGDTRHMGLRNGNSMTSLKSSQIDSHLSSEKGSTVKSSISSMSIFHFGETVADATTRRFAAGAIRDQQQPESRLPKSGEYKLLMESTIAQSLPSFARRIPTPVMNSIDKFRLTLLPNERQLVDEMESQLNIALQKDPQQERQRRSSKPSHTRSVSDGFLYPSLQHGVSQRWIRAGLPHVIYEQKKDVSTRKIASKPLPFHKATKPNSKMRKTWFSKCRNMKSMQSTQHETTMLQAHRQLTENEYDEDDGVELSMAPSTKQLRHSLFHHYSSWQAAAHPYSRKQWGTILPRIENGPMDSLEKRKSRYLTFRSRNRRMQAQGLSPRAPPYSGPTGALSKSMRKF